MPTITLTRPAVYQINGITLLPGDNEITDHQLEGLNANRLVAADMAAGVLVVADDKPARTRGRKAADEGADE